MARRLIIGKHPTFASNGIFLSQPGDSVLAPLKALLLDSRYQNVSVHREGRIRLSRQSFDPTATLWWGTVTWPSLGYTPLTYASLTYASSNDLGIPVSSDYYPTADCAVHETTSWQTLQWGIWLADSTTMRAKMYVEIPNVTGAVDLNYIILKRAL